MKRILSILLVAVPAAVVALLWTSAPSTAQPVPAPGLRAVQHGSAFTGSGTTAAPLNLSPQACGGGSAVAGWGSDGTPTCVATGTLDGTGSAGKLTYWADADTIGYGTGSTSVQHQGSLSVTQDLSASGLLYVLGKLSDSTSTGTSGQVLTVNGSGYPRWTAPSGGDIEGVTTTSPLSGGCTSGTCALTTSMSTARILGRTTASTGVVEQLTGTQATAMLDVATSALKGLVPAWPNNTTTFFRGDGTYATPPDADHALVTSGAIPRGNGTTQVASLLTDDGSTVTNAGDTDLTAGATTVGALGGTVERYSGGGTINDYPLAADTTTLEITVASTTSLTGMLGGWDGRRVRVRYRGASANTVDLRQESANSTEANRFSLGGQSSWTYAASAMPEVDCEYDGIVSRWQCEPIGWVRFPSLYSYGAATLNSTATVTGAATFNGDVTVGNASTDELTVSARGANVAIPIGRQIFTSSGTYTPTSGTYKVRIRLVGGGGGGGSTDDKATGSAESAAAGGASGAYLEHWIDPGAAITGGTVTVGAGGAGGTTSTSGAQGSTGGDSSVVVQGVTYTAHGGTGGYGGMSSGTSPVIVQGGAGGGASATSGTPDVAANGRDGGYALRVNGTQAVAGKGGDSMLGKGGYPRMDPGTGYAGGAYGGGGGGGFDNALTSRAGGAGAAGVVIIEEYR